MQPLIMCIDDGEAVMILNVLRHKASIATENGRLDIARLFNETHDKVHVAHQRRKAVEQAILEARDDS